MAKKLIIFVSILIVCSLIFKGIAYTQTRVYMGDFEVDGIIITNNSYELQDAPSTSTPPTNYHRIFGLSDGKLYHENDASTITELTGGGAGDVTAGANIPDNAIVTGDGGAKGIQGSTTLTWDGLTTMVLNDGTYSHNIINSQAEGLAGSDLRIGLDESNRALLIMDSGDVGTDLGLGATGDPKVYIFDGTPTGGRLQLSANSISMELGRQFQLVGSRAADPFVFTFSADLTFGDAYNFLSQADKELTDTDGEQTWLSIEPKINQSGTAAYNALKIDVTETATGDGSTGDGNNLINAAIGGTSKFTVNNSGLTTASANLTVGNGSTSAGVLTLLEDTDAGANFASFQVPALAGNTVYILPVDDGDANEVLSTNGTGTLDWVPDADSGGATAYHNIGDPVGAGSITFGDTETATYATAEDGGTFFNINGTDADLAGDTIFLQITTVDNDDTNYIPLRIADDSGGDDDTLLQVSSTGAIITATPTTLEPAELDRLDGLTNVIVTDTTAVTEVDGRSLTIGAGTLDADAELYTQTKCIIIETPTDADNFIMYHVELGAQVTAAHAIVENATSATIEFRQCDVAGDNCTLITSAIVADVGGQADDGVIDAPDLDVDDWIRCVVTAVNGTPGHVTACITFTMDD